MTILLIRHATNPNVGKGLTGWLPGVSLNEAGIAQAERLASELAYVPLGAIYSSPLERATETASPLAQHKKLPILTNPDLGEVHYGEWQGQKFAEIHKHERWSAFEVFRSSTRPPAGELMLETQARMVRALCAIRDAHPDETVAVFSHGDAIKSAIMHFLGIPIDFHDRMEILPASVSVLELFFDHARVRAVNISCNPEYYYPRARPQI